MENPFIKHEKKINGCYGTAQKMRDVILNLYNGNSWPLSGQLSSLINNGDEDHWLAMKEIFEWYHVRGENCPVFMALGRDLAERAVKAREEEKQK